MPLHDELAARATYDAVADAYADHFRATEGEDPLDLAMIDRFTDWLAAPRRVLDAGCGAGRMLPYLAARGCVVEGVDLSPEMIRRARTDHPEFPTSVASLTELPHPDATFDGALAWYSIIHSPDADLPAILTELRRVLRPGGLLALGFQTGDGVREVGAGYRKRGLDVDLRRWHRSPDAVAAVAVDAGLTEAARLVRAPQGVEADGQAVLILRA